MTEKKKHDQRQCKEVILAYNPIYRTPLWGNMAWPQEQEAGWFPSTYRKQREGEGKEREGSQVKLEFLTLKAYLQWHIALAKCHLLPQKTATRWRWNIQIRSLWGIFLIQTTTEPQRVNFLRPQHRLLFLLSFLQVAHHHDTTWVLFGCSVCYNVCVSNHKIFTDRRKQMQVWWFTLVIPILTRLGEEGILVNLRPVWITTVSSRLSGWDSLRKEE